MKNKKSVSVETTDVYQRKRKRKDRKCGLCTRMVFIQIRIRLLNVLKQETSSVLSADVSLLGRRLSRVLKPPARTARLYVFLRCTEEPIPFQFVVVKTPTAIVVESADAVAGFCISLCGRFEVPLHGLLLVLGNIAIVIHNSDAMPLS